MSFALAVVKVGLCSMVIHGIGGSCAKRYIDGTTGRRSDSAHHYIYNQAHNPNLQVWAGKRVKRVIFE